MTKSQKDDAVLICVEAIMRTLTVLGNAGDAVDPLDVAEELADQLYGWHVDDEGLADRDANPTALDGAEFLSDVFEHCGGF